MYNPEVVRDYDSTAQAKCSLGAVTWSPGQGRPNQVCGPNYIKILDEQRRDQCIGGAAYVTCFTGRVCFLLTYLFTY